MVVKHNSNRRRSRCPLLCIPERPEASTSDTVIISIVPVCHHLVSVLFDPGSTYSYVFAYFSSRFDTMCDHIPMLVHVST